MYATSERLAWPSSTLRSSLSSRRSNSTDVLVVLLFDSSYITARGCCCWFGVLSCSWFRSRSVIDLASWTCSSDAVWDILRLRAVKRSCSLSNWHWVWSWWYFLGAWCLPNYSFASASYDLRFSITWFLLIIYPSKVWPPDISSSGNCNLPSSNFYSLIALSWATYASRFAAASIKLANYCFIEVIYSCS